jgi:hypothetical protein
MPQKAVSLRAANMASCLWSLGFRVDRILDQNQLAIRELQKANYVPRIGTALAISVVRLGA